MGELTNWFQQLNVDTLRQYHIEAWDLDNPMVFLTVTSGSSILVEGMGERSELLGPELSRDHHKIYSENILMFFNLMEYISRKLNMDPDLNFTVSQSAEIWRGIGKYPTKGTFLLANLLLGIEDGLKKGMPFIGASCYFCPNYNGGLNNMIQSHWLHHMHNLSETDVVENGMQTFMLKNGNWLRSQPVKVIMQELEDLRCRVKSYVNDNYESVYGIEQNLLATPDTSEQARAMEGTTRVL